MLPSRRALAPILGIVAALAGCASDPPAASHAPATTRPTRPDPPVVAATTLDCRDPIATTDRPDPALRVVDGRVALVTSRSQRTPLPTARSGEPDPAHRWFAKTGLVVRTGSRAEILVSSVARGRVAFRWGNTGGVRATQDLVIDCPGDGRWIAFPGGYLVAAPACVPVVIATAEKVRTVRVPVGHRCPGTTTPARSG